LAFWNDTRMLLVPGLIVRSMGFSKYLPNAETAMTSSALGNHSHRTSPL